jgi:hypothetical protein
MTTYKPDNFQDWRRVLKELEELKGLHRLDEQQGRIRAILRHTGSWRLKECALECVRAMKEPGNELMEEVYSIMCDENAPPEPRMRAVYLVRDLVLRRKEGNEPLPYYQGVTIVDKLRELVGAPMHPILQMRVVRALEKIDEEETDGVLSLKY